MSRVSIHQESGELTLANGRGCRVVLAPEHGHYGLGKFYFGDVPVGPRVPHIVKMGDKFDNSANPWTKVHSGRWTPHHYAQRLEVVEDSGSKGIVKLTGRTGYLDVSATYEMGADWNGIAIDVTACPWKYGLWWPLFVSMPLEADKVDFVQVPFEAPLRREDSQRWAVTMRKWHAPLMIACQVVDGKDMFVAIGYSLQQERLKECILEFAPEDKDGALRAYFPGRIFTPPTNFSVLVSPDVYAPPPYYMVKIVFAVGETQAECVEGYRQACGYDVSTGLYGEVETSLDNLLAMYRDAKVYVGVEGFENKAYKQQIKPDGTGFDAGTGGYGEFIPIGVNVQLAYQFYLRYLSHPEEKWLRERAFSMAGFFCESQRESGAIPTLYWPCKNEFSTYNPFIKEGGFLYATCQMTMGAYNLYRLAVLIEDKEGCDCSLWKEDALKAMDFVVRAQQRDGVLGRSYSERGRYDDVAAPNWPLIALDYFHEVTGDVRYAQTRDALESWVLKDFARPNLWFGWSTDGGGLDLDPLCLNIDILDTFTFVTYCTYRYRRTGDKKYLQVAEDVFAYVWACSIPTQYEGYRHATKGLSFEQLAWHCFDVPFRTCLLVDCLPYLAAATGKRFYMDYYRLMVQTQLAYQLPPPWAAFHIGLGLDPIAMEPADDLGEKPQKYIVEFASLYLEAQQSLLNYRYVGGPDWGIGVDYDPTFQVRQESGRPYVVASSHRLVDVAWDAGQKTLTLTLTPRRGWPGEVVVSWGPCGLVQPDAVADDGQGAPLEVIMRWDRQTGMAAVELPKTGAEEINLTLRQQGNQ